MISTGREWLHRVGFRSFADTRANGEVAPFPAIGTGARHY
jgi:hypothetical protein